MSYTPHLKRGGELYHFRTKGSRNGYSKDPNYRPVGQRATGKLVNGRYVYNIQPKKPVTLASRIKTAGSNAGNWLKDRGSDAKKAAGKAKEAVTGSKARQSYNRNNWTAKNYGSNGGYTMPTTSQEQRDRISKTQRKAQRDADKALNTYNKSLRGRAENAGKAISKFGSEARKNAGNWLTDRGNEAKKAASNVKEFVTGENAKKALEKTKGLSGFVMGKSGKKAAKEAYDKTLPGMVENVKKTAQDVTKNPGKYVDKARKGASDTFDSARKNAGDWLNKRGEDISKAAKNAWDYGKPGGTLDRAAVDTLKKAGKSVSEAAGNAKKAVKDVADNPEKALNDAKKAADSARKSASDWLNDRKEDLSKTASNVAKSADKARKNAGDWLNKRGEDISKAAGNAKRAAGDLADKAGKAADSARKNASDFIDGLTKKKEKSKSNIKPIETKPIETKPIETKPIETKPIETKPIETKPIETKTKKQKVDAKAFTKFVVESNKNANKSSVSTNDKPDGVSDEYWRDYKFNGGTREEWDAQNKASNKKSSSSKSKSNSNMSDYERELAYNSQKNDYFGLGDASNKKDLDYYTVDTKTGKTIWVDKKGKKHYN